MKLNLQNIHSEISQKGFYTINNAIDLNNLDFLDHRYKKGQLSYPVSFKEYLIKLFKLDFKILKQSFQLQKIADNLALKDISDLYYKSDSKIRMIDSYFNEKSNSDIISWHNDLGINDKNFKTPQGKEFFYKNLELTIFNMRGPAKGLKFFIYLTDVESENGSLAIIPFSHQIVRAIGTLIMEKKISLSPFWHLKDLKNLIENEKVKNLIIEKLGKEIVENFLFHTKFIDDQKSDTNHFDIEMKKGGMIIFDELSIHRGSAPKKNDRLVLRYLFQKK